MTYIIGLNSKNISIKMKPVVRSKTATDMKLFIKNKLSSYLPNKIIKLIHFIQ